MKKAPKEDPPLLARPETPDDFERFEAQAFEVRCSDPESTDPGSDGSQNEAITVKMNTKNFKFTLWFSLNRSLKSQMTHNLFLKGHGQLCRPSKCRFRNFKKFPIRSNMHFVYEG